MLQIHKACIVVGVLLCFAVASKGYSLPLWYQCDPQTCSRPDCQCASVQSPLAIEETPQFILLSNDDSVTRDIAEKMANMVGDATNPGGCPIPTTWFVLGSGTDCFQAKRLYRAGHEMASHTLTHPELTANISQAEAEEEILGGRNYLINNCGLPEKDIIGYRSTYLTTNPTTKQILYDQGFKYDTSHTFYAGTEDVLAQRIWPHTMDFGVADNACDGVYQICGPEETYKGFWEVPVWELVYDGQSYAMDPGANSAGNGEERSAFDVLKTAFDASYAGNRAPIPFYVHLSWFEGGNRTEDGGRFIEYALSKPDVYFVTFSQMIEWMEDPIPVSAMPQWLQLRCESEGGVFGNAKGDSVASIGNAPTLPPEPVELSWLRESGPKFPIL